MKLLLEKFNFTINILLRKIFGTSSRRRRIIGLQSQPIFRRKDRTEAQKKSHHHTDQNGHFPRHDTHLVLGNWLKIQSYIFEASSDTSDVVYIKQKF